MPPPETGVLYTCREHWNRLYNEANVAAERHEGDVKRRPLYLEGMLRIGMWDTRVPSPFSGKVSHERN